VMEAMAAGLPIVSTAAGGVPNLLENGKEGLIVQPGDVDGLSSAMTFLSGNRELRQFLGGAAARRAKEKFDVSKMVQAYEELYESLVNQEQGLNTQSALHQQGVSLRQV
jgi:glycosyltransferase involved in cell wall biosynthesis